MKKINHRDWSEQEESYLIEKGKFRIFIEVISDEDKSPDENRAITKSFATKLLGLLEENKE